MQKFKDALREEQKRLEEIIAKAKKENEHMPEGNLRISKHKNRCRYYHCVHDRNGIYICVTNNTYVFILLNMKLNFFLCLLEYILHWQKLLCYAI